MARNTMAAANYRVAMSARGDLVLMCTSASTLLSHVTKKRDATYESASKATKFCRGTLYVYAQRLERAGLLKREQRLVRGRYHTFLMPAEGIQTNVPLRRI